MRRAALLGLCAALAAGQDFSEIRMETLVKGASFAEGPAWSAKDGYLIFSDTPADRLMKWVPGHDVEVFRAGANGPSGNAFDTDGRLYTCETRTRRVTRTDRKGAVEVLAERWEGKRLNAPNDIVVARGGHVYFTDPAFGSQADARELDFYGVYHIPPKGPMKLVAKTAGRPNGIALSPNGRVLYVTITEERAVRAWDVDRNGDTSNERVAVSKLPGLPGGVRTDDKGNLYVAAKGIAIYSAEGNLLHHFELGGRITNFAFGEPDGQSLLVTAADRLLRARLGVKGAY